MPNQSFKNTPVKTQTSWSGTHGAKQAVIISAQAGMNHPLPVSATYLTVVPDPIGTVVVLCSDAMAMAQLQQSLAGSNVLIQSYFSLHTILSANAPTGPACLVVDLDGQKPGNLQFYELLKTRGWRLPTIMLAGHPEIRAVVQLMRAGAEDVLLKSAEPGELVTAIHHALHHSSKRLQRRPRNDEAQRRLKQLTSREVEIVKLVLAGMLNKEIAERLQLALVTVKVHRGSAMRKLGARSAAELARLTLTTNVLSPMELVESRLEALLACRPLPAD